MHHLLELRNKIGISQSTMADMLGLKRSTYSLIELGKRNLPDDLQPLVNWISYNLPRLLEEEISPSAEAEILQRELRKQKVKLQNLKAKAEKKEDDKKVPLRTKRICDGLTGAFGDKLSVKILKRLDSIQYDAALVLEKKPKSTAALRDAQIKGLEALVSALEEKLAIQK